MVKVPFNFRCLEEHPCKDCQYWPIYPCYSSKRPMVACIHEYTNDPISTFREDPDKYRLVYHCVRIDIFSEKWEVMEGRRRNWQLTFLRNALNPIKHYSTIIQVSLFDSYVVKFFQLSYLHVWASYHWRPRCKALQVRNVKQETNIFQKAFHIKRKCSLFVGQVFP